MKESVRILLLAGPRARIGDAVVGADLLAITGDYGGAYGWQVTAGIGGRPGKYVLAASAIGGAVLGIVFLVAFSQQSTH